MFPAATISAPLMMRKFKIGQPLLYYPTNRMKAQGRFIVIGLFPQPNGKVHYRISLPDQHDQPLAAGDASIEKVPLQHGQSHAFETNNTACGTYDVFWMGSALLRINVSQAHYRAAIPYELNYFKGL